AIEIAGRDPIAEIGEFIAWAEDLAYARLDRLGRPVRGEGEDVDWDASVGRLRAPRRDAVRGRGLQEEWRAQARGKVAAALRHRRHVRDRHAPDQLARPLEVAEEESTILDDRAADGEAVLVAAEDRLFRVGGRRGREQVAGVQRLVAQKFKCCPVQFVRAGFGRQVNDAPGESPALARRRMYLDHEHLYGVDHRTEGDLPRLRLQRRNAVVEV